MLCNCLLQLLDTLIKCIKSTNVSCWFAVATYVPLSKLLHWLKHANEKCMHRYNICKPNTILIIDIKRTLNMKHPKSAKNTASFSRLECGIHDRLHIYPLCGIFYFPWHRHQIEGTNSFYCLIRKTERFTISNVESQVCTPNNSRLDPGSNPGRAARVTNECPTTGLTAPLYVFW